MSKLSISVKKKIISELDARRSEITALAVDIGRHPEIAWTEGYAAGRLCAFLDGSGFDIERGFCGIDTAFNASFGDTDMQSGVPAVLAEYDALPAVGHGCGHNLIAAAAAGAAVALASAAGRHKPLRGFRIIGTPAEEVVDGISGKTLMLERGGFGGLSSALIFHPWTATGVARKDLGYSVFRAVFTGRTAHAAADPWNGRNALDAAVSFYNSLSMLRQQLPPGVKMHIILPEAGEALNIIPEKAVAEVMVRSTELDYLHSAEKGINGCAAGAAASAGCGFSLDKIAAVKPVLFNEGLFDLVSANYSLAADSGEPLRILPLWEASSDFGDVSRTVPALSLLYKTHDADICWHSRDVAAASTAEPALASMLEASKILALTLADLIYGG